MNVKMHVCKGAYLCVKTHVYVCMCVYGMKIHSCVCVCVHL